MKARFNAAALAALAACAIPPAARAEYPERPVRYIVKRSGARID